MNEPSDHPSRSPHPSRPGLEGLDLRQLMAEGIGLDPESEGYDAMPSIPGYELLRLLGAGGMGRVYLARQLSLNRLVAVKVLASVGSVASHWLDRLEREAHAMARVGHPNIVAVYDFIRLSDGGAAIVMEWVESGNLRERWLSTGRPMRDLGTVVSVIREIALSLTSAHHAGIVHRDLKPENVLIALDGSVKVTDFGLALPLDEDSRRFSLTGTTVGTLGYMAPEQIEGRAVDERADLYSLGVILYEMITGIRPHGHFDPPRAIRRDLPARLDKLTLAALRTRPAHRIASADAFLKELDASRPARRLGKILLPAALLLFLAGLGAFFLTRPVPSDGTVFVERNPIISAASTDRSSPTETIPARPPPPAPAPAPAEVNRLPAGFSFPAAMASQINVKPLRGDWIEESGGYRSDNSVAVLQILTALPPQGADVRITFTRTGGEHSIALFFRSGGGMGSAEVSAWNAGLAGIQTLNGADLRYLGVRPHFSVVNGQRHEMLVEIRPYSVTLKMDGRTVHEVPLAGRALGITFPWAWESLATDETYLALGSYESPTIFHEVEVTEVE